MASSSASSSSEAHFIPNCVYPFLRPTVKRNYQNGSPQHTPIDTMRELHDAITWTVDKYTRQLRLLASRSPVFKNILSFSSHFHQHLSQVRRESYSNVKLLRNHNFAAVLPGDSVAGLVVANGILNFLNIYNTLLVVRLVLTWFPNTPPAIVSPLSTLCDPYLNIFRGIIPPLGGTLDLSPILALVVLNAFTSTAAALPAELPHPGASLESSPRRFIARGVTSSQEKWMRRLCGRDIKSSGDAN